MGEADVRIWECWWDPGAPDLGRHWFESAEGIQTATYREICQKLCGRRKPRLPADEYRPGVAVDRPANAAETNAPNPETGFNGIAENAFHHLNAARYSRRSQHSISRHTGGRHPGGGRQKAF